jgi:predicted Zn-dependent peptidase
LPEPVTLENGLRVLVSPMPHARSVALALYVATGSRCEADAEAGLSHFVEHMAFKGTTRRPRPQDISMEVDAVGGTLNAATEREYTVYYAKVTPPHTRQTLDVLADMLRASTFVSEEIERERGVILEELAAVEDSPDELAGIALDSLLWPGQPHGRDIAGTPETVGAVSQERLRAYYREQYVANATVLSIAGAVTEAEGLSLARELVGDWAAGRPVPWRPNMVEPGDRTRLVAKDSEQAHITIGALALAATDPRRYALSALSVIIGEGMSSRLFVRLREELALCYDIRSSLTQLSDTGSFGVYAGVDPTNAAATLREIASELRKARASITDDELQRAKGLLTSRIQLHVEDTGAVASWYGSRAVRGLPLLDPDTTVARFEAVTRDEVAAIASEVLTEERMRVAVVGPFESLEPLLDGVHLDG